MGRGECTRAAYIADESVLVFFAIENNLGIVLLWNITVNTLYIYKNASAVSELC